MLTLDAAKLHAPANIGYGGSLEGGIRGHFSFSPVQYLVPPNRAADK